MQNPSKRAILVNVIPPEVNHREAIAEFDELVRLVNTYGGIVILKIIQKRGRPSAKTFVGEGKAREIAQMVKDLKADIVIINGFLKANQSNHLINIIPCEVLDRFEMIIKIFEKHAVSPEAKLQLRIAEYKYEFPKLFGRGAVLSQQAAGIGVATSSVSTASGSRGAARGPGEKILEVKRRHLRDQIKGMERKLTQFRNVRRFQRERRRRRDFCTVALVGYTNSGKSSLMCGITKKGNILVEDKLFSTLDTRLGQVNIQATEYGKRGAGGAPRILLADTIGFMQNMPPLLFSSFLATLEEVKEADLLLHIIDASDPKMFEKIKVVEDVLIKLECSEKPCVYVFNKMDLCNGPAMSKTVDVSYLEHVFEKFSPVFVSALYKHNLKKLLLRIEQNAKNEHNAVALP